jgi:hypothetical protein
MVEPEKRIRSLPTVRISESLETRLMRLAARDDRTLSEYVRRVLEAHVFGHAVSLGDEGSHVAVIRAMQRNAED